MTEILKNLIESYQKGELNTPNIQVIDRIFSDEIIKFTDDVLLDVTFSRAFFKKSRLTKIRFCNGSFESSFFKDCFLENCVFLNIHFQEMKSLKCIFKDCLFIDCMFGESDISETIFESCMFSEGSLDDSEFQSCHFINTVFWDVTFGFGTLIDSKFSDSKKSVKFEEKVYFNDIFDQIKEFNLVKDSLSEDKQENITKLIQTIRDDSQSDNFDSLKSKIEELKTVMTDMMSSKMDNESNSDPMSNLNDL